MPEKILVPLDGSKAGETALPYVEELISKMASGNKVVVTLIQVLSSLSRYVVSGEETIKVPYTRQETDETRKRAVRYLRTAGATLRKAGATTKTKVEVGHPAEEIISAADEIKADMIAMSSHGRSGLSRWAFGSVTDRVLRGGSRPVLVVKVPKETHGA
ncbi:MAG: universal stress protein [Dehalococcoidales bacterium]|nr:universal stress protein [Dehalococcoidales bacterium]MDP7525484.1 universal stress protein [Dehalococcoidales bacterium]